MVEEMRKLIDIVREEETVVMPTHKSREDARLREHSLVRSVHEIHDCDQTVPVGATGTIIDVLSNGYTIEFMKPFHVIASATRDEIAPE